MTSAPTARSSPSAASGAKSGGAIGDKSPIAIIPTENYPQLLDASIYYGPSILTDIQVIGACKNQRLHRHRPAPTAAQDSPMPSTYLVPSRIPPAPTIQIFYKQKSRRPVNQSPRPGANHLSARILLDAIHNKNPTTLSEAASYYYAMVAVKGMLAVIKDQESAEKPSIPPWRSKSGLADLKKLRPMWADSEKPLLDAWNRFILSIYQLQQGTGSSDTVERQRQALMDEVDKQATNQDMLQKMMSEGI